MKLTYIVKNTDNFNNLKEIIKLKFQVSDRLIQKLKKEEKIYINNIPSRLWQQVKPNDKIEVYIDFHEESSNIIPTKMNLSIIYEDETYIIINKPSGITVHPSMDHYEDSLSNGLKYYFDSIKLYRKIRPVNRLDKNTSGIVVFAKNEFVQEFLVKQMQNKIFKKEYIAICNGCLKEKQGSIDFPIARKENSIIERCVNLENGAPSITHYEVIKSSDTYSVVRCILETGRTHQIRVHMQAIGHSILGDTLYGSPSILIDRQALHAHKIQFIHPITHQKVSYIAPLPSDMKRIVSLKEKN